MARGLGGGRRLRAHGAGTRPAGAADPRIAAQVHAALGDARTVLNVGAGAGSYEPADRYVLAVEPSAAMRAQRPPGAPGGRRDRGARCRSTTTASTPRWRDHRAPVVRPRAGPARAASGRRGPVVVLTFDPARCSVLAARLRARGVIALERRRSHDRPRIRRGLGGRRSTRPDPVDCMDGFIEAYYGRPGGASSTPRSGGRSRRGLRGARSEALAGQAPLRADLANGTWNARHGHLRSCRRSTAHSD